MRVKGTGVFILLCVEEADGLAFSRYCFAIWIESLGLMSVEVDVIGATGRSVDGSLKSKFVTLELDFS